MEKEDIPLHEETECPKRIIPCTLGCGIDDLWAQDEEQHKTHECPKRLLPCILKCKLMIPEDEMVKHVRKFCRRRIVKQASLRKKYGVSRCGKALGSRL